MTIDIITRTDRGAREHKTQRRHDRRRHMKWDYRGQNRSGTSTTGTFTAPNPVEFVESKFRGRWQWLEVVDADGDVAGSITDRPKRPAQGTQDHGDRHRPDRRVGQVAS